ncbi:membrane protein [Philodulcilactobacillus myokoensis]|uniref:Membrane protein n=1 Tax=Philodulcilactobacillus myokoensis TaxID=2929573 RepID=A0A9W6B0E7_9LACO|nr:hypothetical protein [Philodulcilactobacillus myokoensis]GLB46260.1 membrane protein [Philodulcilactobacillus myokoensis]
MRNHLTKLISPLIICLFAIFIIFPEITHHAMIVGVDYAFHMNRFYDTAMQIKSANISPFQTNFGFDQSGRIVNAVYGPVIAYINGLLLLICKTIFNYQIVSNLIVLITAGILIYFLAVKNHVSKFNALFISMIYMGTHPVLAWITGQQFTGMGAAILPLLFIPATQMIKKHDVNLILLAISMVLLLQTHFMSSAVGAVAILPFFIVGLISAPNKHKKMLLFKHTVEAALLTILLTLNLWANLFEVSGTNHIIPIFPQTDFNTDTIMWSNWSLDLLGPLVTLMFAALLIFTIIRWRKISLVNRVTVFTGIIFLWMSSWLFPWNQLSRFLPILDTTVQLPKRLMVISCILLLLAIGMDLSTVKIPQWAQIIKIAIVLFIFGDFAIDTHHNINSFLTDWSSKQVVSSDQTVQSLTIQEKNPDKLRHALLKDNFQKSAPLVQKTIPDYLPAREKITPANYYNYHFRRNYYYQIIKPSIQTKKTVNGTNLNVTWNNNFNQSKWQMIPITKYAHSSVKLNGKYVSNAKTSAIGTLVVKAKPGQNHVQLSYQPSLIWKALMIIFTLSWIGFILDLIFKKGKWHRQ